MRSVIRAACPPAKRAASEEGAFSLTCGPNINRVHPSVACTRPEVTQQLRPPMGSSSHWAPPCFCIKDPPFLYSHIYNPKLPSHLCLCLPPLHPFLPSRLFFPLLPLLGLLSWHPARTNAGSGRLEVAAKAVGAFLLARWERDRGTQQRGCKFPRAGLLLRRQHEEAVLRLLRLPAGRCSSSR